MTLLAQLIKGETFAFFVVSTFASLAVSSVLMLRFHSALALISSKPIARYLHHHHNGIRSSTSIWRISSSQMNQLSLGREADFVETTFGVERYSMVKLPDSMFDTTLFVGNLCEFVKDEDLSTLFKVVSILHFIPACVVRKPNAQSMQYGFVSFPTVEEKEAAIIRFNGFEWRGKKLKVEALRDDPKQGRVRVPESIVSYVSGEAKKTKSGKVNELRRISADDVERLSRGEASKKRGFGSRAVPHRLNEEERTELNRAMMKGYLSLVGLGNRRSRKGSPLTNIHRQYCDSRAKPQIVLYKAVGGQAADSVVIDLSPLRLNALSNQETVQEFLVKWKTEILSEAYKADMQLAVDIVEEEEDDDDEDEDEMDDISNNAYYVTIDETSSQDAWASQPIWKLPILSIGVFQGGRPNAKAMARSLALLWDIPEEEKGLGSRPQGRRSVEGKNDRRTEATGQKEHRKRGGGHRQSFS